MGRNLIAGDIHCHCSLLREALDKAGFEPERDTLYSVGDISDRGPEPLELLRFLMSLPDYRPVLGNHDLHLRDYLVSDILDGEWMASDGGADTVNAFIRNKVSHSERQEIGEWLSSVPYVRIEEKYIIIHGGVPKGWTMTELELIAALRPRPMGYAIAEDPASSPLWNRSYLQSAMAFEHGADISFLQPPLDTEKRIFIGHTPLSLPFISDIYRLAAVDTGAGHGKKLTVMDMDTLEYWQAGRG